MRALPSSEMPTMDSKSGTSRCQPSGVPVRYSATRICSKRAGSTDPAKFLPEVAKTNYQGVIGPIAFDDKGDLKNGPITIYVVKGGKWEPLETITPSGDATATASAGGATATATAGSAPADAAKK